MAAEAAGAVREFTPTNSSVRSLTVAPVCPLPDGRGPVEPPCVSMRTDKWSHFA
jgi:hypothetical protein